MSAKIPDQKQDVICLCCRYEFRSYREEPDCPRCGRPALHPPVPAGRDEIEGKIRETLLTLGLSANRLQFVDPEDWRGDEVPTGALLIVTYEGSGAGEAFAYDLENHSATDVMADALDAIGVYSEEQSNWYSAIYPAKEI